MKITVTIPTYNRAHLLGDAIDSVLNQTYRNFEIIVIDDGSTDGTEAMVARYGDRVRYFRQPNGGIAAARNAALDRATGDCIAFLDSDDLWYPFKLELQVQLLQGLPDVSFLFTDFDILKEDGRIIRQGSRTWLTRDTRWEKIYPRRISSRALDVRVAGATPEFCVYSGNLYRHFLDDPFVLPSTALVRRDVLGALRFTEGMRVFADWEFFGRLARDRDGAFAEIETTGNRGHDDPTRLTRCSPLVKAQCYLVMFERVWKADADFRNRYPDAVRSAESAATLAVARTALLESEPHVARQALQGWTRVQRGSGAAEALAYSLLSRVPGGRQCLRAAVFGRHLARRVVSGSQHGSTQVHSAA